MRLAKLATALAAPLLLTGCFLTPGKFTSELQLMRDGSFAYAYNGEIQMLALSKLAEMGAKAEDEFEPDDCYDQGGDLRECSAVEIAEQKTEWDEKARERAERKAREAEQLKLMMGGIDPSSPEAAAELAEHLQRQKGWRRVEHKGDGLFEVDFAIAGSLTHDFAFPTIERMPVGAGFVNIILRKQGQVRIDAPGFAAQGAGNPMQAMMGGMMGLAQMESAKGEKDVPSTIARPEGRFTVFTDGEILANNTDEGPKMRGSMRVLTWEITPRTEQAPTALIALE